MHSHTRFLVGVTHKISYNLDSIRSPKHLKHWAPVCLSSVDRSPFGRPVIHNFCYTRPIRSTDYPDLFGRPVDLRSTVSFAISSKNTTVLFVVLYNGRIHIFPIYTPKYFWTGRTKYHIRSTVQFVKNPLLSVDTSLSNRSRFLSTEPSSSVDRYLFGRPLN